MRKIHPYEPLIFHNSKEECEQDFHNNLRLIPGFENEGYFASDDGKIWSAKVKGGQGSLNFDNIHEMTYKYDKDGYKEICISIVDDGKHRRIYRRAHRLVYEAHYGKIPNDLTVDHIDENIHNNDISNLQLLTREENSLKSAFGREYKYGHSRPIKVTNLDTGESYISTIVDEANKFGVNRETINRLRFDPTHTYGRKGILAKKNIHIKVEDVEDIERIDNH